MRVLFLSTLFPPGPGGIATHGSHVARHLKRLGWDVEVVSVQPFAAVNDVSNWNGQQPYSITTLPLAGGVLGVLHRAKIILGRVRAFEPDLILSSGDRINYLTALLRSLHGKRFVFVEHGNAPTGWQLLLKRWAYRRAEVVISVSRYTESRLLAMGVRPRRSAVIPNGAEPDDFCMDDLAAVREFRRDLGVDGGYLLLTVGSVTERKGQEVVIMALPKVLAEVPMVHYAMAGIPARGAGAVVVKDCEDALELVGVPARPLASQTIGADARATSRNTAS